MMNPHMHGGKWSQEEELYASALIDAFKAGELPRDDIEEGTSLRKYLSKKLMCSPKRVSKKYEGTNYNGKQVYFRNRSATVANDLAIKAKLQILEHNFLRTLSETKLTPSQGPLTLPTMPNASSELQMINQLQMQALTDTSRSMTGGLFSAAQSQLHAGIPSAASLPQSSNYAGVGDLLTRSNLMGGSNLLGGANLQGGGNLQLGGLASWGAGSLVPRTDQEQDFANIAARLNAANQLSFPSAGTAGFAAGSGDSSHAHALAQLNASRTLMESAQLRQLEESILARSQMAALNRSGATALQSGTNPHASSLEALARRRSSAMARPPAGLDQLSSSLAPQAGAHNMLDYLAAADSIAAARAPGVAAAAPSATDLLGGAARATLLLHNTNLQEQQASVAAMAANQDSARRVSQLLGGAGVASAGASTGALGRAGVGAAKRSRDEDQDNSDSSKRWRGPPR
ncbi:RING [Seminavis robusta]|uniref:RING n=1 Tax=Seminavis robusta TaxID=568900 RepID=A0A9N8HMQ1_9STRA|nr:RING [Seminavis robusta]|eukprot:Sro1139_g245490.1 RING (458) ;mRNA; f:33461-34937